jgi:hypothetical protein
VVTPEAVEGALKPSLQLESQPYWKEHSSWFEWEGEAGEA